MHCWVTFLSSIVLWWGKLVIWSVELLLTVLFVLTSLTRTTGNILIHQISQRVKNHLALLSIWWTLSVTSKHLIWNWKQEENLCHNYDRNLTDKVFIFCTNLPVWLGNEMTYADSRYQETVYSAMCLPLCLL